ncbi:hypothetical protein TNCV_4804901 [Trichonephila clavipes]|nr:hypothetical protein TNCV_4804901 [Trichonephila clavipes]
MNSIFLNTGKQADSRISIHPLYEWWRQGDRTTRRIVQLLHSLSTNVKIFFQWVPSHGNVCGNDIADRAAVNILHMGTALLFQKLLPGSNKISVLLGGRPPYMSGMKETVLVPLCLGQAVGEMKLLLQRVPQWTYSSSLACDGDRFNSCQVIYSQFGLAIHQNDHQARRRFVEWAQNETAVVPDFHKRILFSDEAHFWLNGYVNKQNCRIWSEANPQVYVETPLHPEKLTVCCALLAGGPYFFKNDEGHNVTVNGDRYRAMITNCFIPELTSMMSRSCGSNKTAQHVTQLVPQSIY